MATLDGSSGKTTVRYQLGWWPGHEDGAPKGAHGEVVYGPRRGEAVGVEKPEAFTILLFSCDRLPDSRKPASNRNWITTIVGPPSRPYHRVEFPSHFYQDWHKRDWDWGVSKPKLAGQIFGNTDVFILHVSTLSLGEE